MAEDLGMFGLPQREAVKDPNATRTPVVGSVPVPGVTRPQKADFSSAEKGLDSLSKVLGEIGVSVSAWADKEKLKEEITGQMMYQQGKTAQEVMTQEGHFARAGWHAMNAETQANQWMQQALIDIADKDKALAPQEYRKKLQDQVNEMTNALGEAPPEAMQFLATQTSKIFPELVKEHMKAFAKHNDEQTSVAFTNLAVTKATDPKSSELDLAQIFDSPYGQSEKGKKVIVETLGALSAMGPAGVDGYTKASKALGLMDTSTSYGFRADGSPKGPGFLGPLKHKDGKVSTELSIGVHIDGKETEIPTLVPTLTKPEVDSLLNGDKPSKEIVDKAVAFAKTRIQSGKSPFAEGVGPMTQADILDKHFEQESGRKQIGGKGSVDGPDKPTKSPAGAIGYSQIMPEYAEWIAGKVGMKWDRTKFYWDQNYNKEMGEKYYGYLLGKFNGDPEKAIAAYNRGPNALQDILSKYPENSGDWKNDPALSAETKKHLNVVFGGRLAPLQNRGFTAAQLEAIGLADSRAQAERSTRFTVERTNFEMNILKTIDEGQGTLAARDKIMQYQKEQGLSDQWANSTFDSVVTRQNKYDEKERVRQNVLGSLANNTVMDQPARERELAFDMVQQSLIGQAQANEMNPEQTKEFVRSRMADFIVANQGVVDTRIQNRIQGGPLQDPVGKDGKINQGVLEAYKDYIALSDKGGSQVADAYAGKAADFYHDVRTYDTGTNTQEALIAANKRYMEENKMKYKVSEDEVQSAIKTVIHDTSPDRWYYNGDQRTNDEVNSLKNSPAFTDIVTRLAQMDMALNDGRDPGASALKAARAATERGELMLGSFVMSSHGSSIKQDMGISSAEAGAAEKAVLLALATQGPKVYGDKWQTAIDRDARVPAAIANTVTAVLPGVNLADAIVNQETKFRGVPEGVLQYMPKSKEFLFYPKIPSWFNPLGSPSYGEKAVVIKAEDAGKAFTEDAIKNRSGMYRAVEALVP